MPITRKEFERGKLYWWRRLLPKPKAILRPIIILVEYVQTLRDKYG